MKKVKDFLIERGLCGSSFVRPSTNSHSKWRRALEGELLACLGVPGQMVIAAGCRKTEQMYFSLRASQAKSGMLVMDLSPGMLRRSMVMPVIEGDPGRIRPQSSIGEIELNCKFNKEWRTNRVTGDHAFDNNYVIEVVKMAPKSFWHTGTVGPASSALVMFTNYIHYIPWPLANLLMQGEKKDNESRYVIQTVSSTMSGEDLEKLRAVAAAGKL